MVRIKTKNKRHVKRFPKTRKGRSKTRNVIKRKNNKRRKTRRRRGGLTPEEKLCQDNLNLYNETADVNKKNLICKVMRRYNCPEDCNIIDDKHSQFMSIPHENISTPPRTPFPVYGDFDLRSITGQLRKEEMEKMRAKRNLEQTIRKWKTDGGQTEKRGYAVMADAIKNKANNSQY